MVVALFWACSTPKKIEQEVIVVRVPPFYDSSLTPGQNHWLWQEFLFPDNTDGTARPKGASIPDAGIPNDDSLLYVSLRSDGSLHLNMERQGDSSNTEPLKHRLTNIFGERERTGVFEPGNWRVVKAVGIRIPDGARYGDLINIAQAVKESGADPIVLLLDGHLPGQLMVPVNH